MAELLWSDPRDDVIGHVFNVQRGGGTVFGPDVTQAFLQRNSLELLIRSHECCMNGYAQHHNGQVLTVFSAPNYCGQVGNRGALIRFDDSHHQQNPLFLVYDASSSSFSMLDTM